MKGLIVAVAALLMAPVGMAAAQQAAPPLNAEAARSLSDFQNFGPHRAFVIGADGRASWYVGVGGADPGNAVSSALKRCEERGKLPCTLHVVNNYTVTGADWRAQVPARAADAPDIGRMRPEPYLVDARPPARRRPDRLEPWLHGRQERDQQRAAVVDRPLHAHGLRPLSLRPRMDRRLGGRRHGAGRGRAQGTRDGLSPRRAGRPVGRRLGIAGGAGARRTGRRRDLDRRGPPWRGDQDARRHHAGPLGMAES